MAYKHTQIGYLMLFILFASVLFFGIILTQVHLELIFIILLIFVLLIIVSFLSLKIVIDKNYLQIKFGYGLYKKYFSLKEITSAKIVRNHWYYGWGIRLWAWPHMWIFNVSGFDAVEIKMKNGRIYRIGTDEPKKLEQAIKKEIQ